MTPIEPMTEVEGGDLAGETLRMTAGAADDEGDHGGDGKDECCATLARCGCAV
jgi:hypothetical protein